MPLPKMSIKEAMEQLRRFKNSLGIPSIMRVRTALADAYYEEHNTTARVMVLHLDEADYEAVQRCIARRQLFRSWPASVSDEDDENEPLADGSNIAGLAIAEICRGWEEMLEMGKEE